MSWVNYLKVCVPFVKDVAPNGDRLWSLGIVGLVGIETREPGKVGCSEDALAAAVAIAARHPGARIVAWDAREFPPFVGCVGRAPTRSGMLCQACGRFSCGLGGLPS